MKKGHRIGMGCMTFICGFALPITAQHVDGKGSAPHLLVSSSSAATSPAQLSEDVYREIVDPNNGDRWLLLRNPSHPGGPGRMVLAQRTESAQIRPGLAGARARAATESVAQMQIIHSGDRLIVEEDSAVVDERLEAVALGPAAEGAFLAVRLTIGGKVFRAEALGPGRAAFAPADGAP